MATKLDDLEVDLLLKEDEIKKRIKSLAGEIDEYFKGKVSDAEPLNCIALLRGGAIFTADLFREITVESRLYFLVASSYGDERKSGGSINIKFDVSIDVKDKILLLCEDVIDSGLTLTVLRKHLLERGAKAVYIAALCDKRCDHKEYFITKEDYEGVFIGFEIPTGFTLGYGMDYAGKYRNLKDIYRIKP